MRHSATVSVGHSRRRLKVACQGDGQHVNGKSEELPSSIFLISTERSATSLSTTNCSLSEVTRRTIVGVDEGCSVYRQVADRIIRRSEQTLFHPLTGQCHHAPINVLSTISTPFRFGLFAFLCPRSTSFNFILYIISPLAGSIRTATKRAGGSVRNHGGSPGKRLGVKKFSGALSFRLPRRCI